jgi:aminopeptidase N
MEREWVLFQASRTTGTIREENMMRWIVTTAATWFLMFFITGLTTVQAEDASGQQLLPRYRLAVSFDLPAGLVRGTARITVPAGGTATVEQGGLRLISAILNGSPVAVLPKDTRFKLGGSDTLDLVYEGTFSEPGGPGGNAAFSSGFVDSRGVALTGMWYPAVKGLAYFELTALVPSDFTALSEADSVAVRETATGKEYSFDFPHPLTGVDLVAGAYREFRDTVDGISLYAYFFPEDASLVPTYLEHAKKYFELYNRLLIPYPYKRFSIVENRLPTGESMPTFTLLGQEVVRLPFIPETSLGHEITHQWFGNYVYADFSAGNWLEAITSYMSDHLYREQEGRGWEYRKNVLIEFQSYVTPDRDFPLRKFQERTDAASMAIGYGKGAMLFHMLEDVVGKEVFSASLRRLLRNNAFREASWTDVEQAFEQESGRDLAWFFKQWLDRTGAPALSVQYAGSRERNGIPTAEFELVQQNDPFRFLLPATAFAGLKERTDVLSVETGAQYFRISPEGQPSSLVLDGSYDVMRSLVNREFPPVIARLLGDPKKLFVYPDREKEAFESLISLLRERGFTIREEGAVRDADIASSSLVIAGADSPVWRRLFGTRVEQRPGFALEVRENPLNRDHVVAVVTATSREEVDLAAPKIVHYGTYSVLRFERGQNVAKEEASSDRGMRFDLREPVAAIRPDEPPALAEIIDAVSKSPVVLIGERHEHYEDHKAELAIIRGLFEKGKRIAIGMEMFQKPFQGAVNDYLAGAIDERMFLKKTEYFKRWGFDYNLYREIIEFARAKGIPIVALNQRTEIMDAVAKGGLDALSPEQRKEIPQGMNMADESYRKRLREVYDDHPAGTTFENFYQSQILWDETMAHSAINFLQEKPDYQMVVLAGAEHIMYKDGIPGRIERLSGKPCVTLVNGAFDRGVGSYVLFPEPLDPPFTPKLGVILNEGKGVVRVDDFTSDSAARKAGMERGDIIRAVDGWQTSSVSDVKIALFDREPGQTVRVQVLRERFLLGSKEHEFHVEL